MESLSPDLARRTFLKGALATVPKRSRQSRQLLVRLAVVDPAIGSAACRADDDDHDDRDDDDRPRD